MARLQNMFKVLTAEFDFNGRKYKAGDVVHTNSDLEAAFPSLFSRIEVELVQAPSPDEAPAVKQNSKAKILPQTASDDESVHNDVPAPEKPAQATLGEGAGNVKGKEVTKMFPLALDEDFRVFKHDGKYFVYDADDMSLVNAKGSSKTGVAGVIKKAVAR